MIAAPFNLTITRGVTFGPLVMLAMDAAGVAVNLTGFSALAYARKTPKAAPLDLAPAITAPAAGRIEIGTFTDEQTLAMQTGSYKWDLVLQDAAGNRYGPYLAGRCTVKEVQTRAAA